MIYLATSRPNNGVLDSNAFYKSGVRFPVHWFIGSIAPDWSWLLRHIESEDGFVRFPALFTLWITNLNIGNYPELYEEEARIGGMRLRSFLIPEEIRELDAELVSLSP